MVSSTISSPVPLPSRSGTLYSITRTRCPSSRVEFARRRGRPARTRSRRAPRSFGLTSTEVYVPSERTCTRGNSSWVGARHNRAAPVRQRLTPRLEGVEVAVRGQQLIGLQPPVQRFGQGLLPHRVRGDLGGEERVRAALGQRDHPRLRVCRPVRSRPGVAELGRVLRTVGQVHVEPVDGQHPPVTQHRAPGEHPTHRLGHRVEHLGEHLAAQPFAGLGNRAGRGHRPSRVPTPPPVKGPGDLGRDLLIVIVAEQAQRHRQVRRHMCRQLPTRTPVADPTGRDRGVDHVPRHRADQHTQRHLIR